MQLHARNRIESSAQSHAQRKCPTSSAQIRSHMSFIVLTRYLEESPFLGNNSLEHSEISFSFLLTLQNIPYDDMTS